MPEEVRFLKDIKLAVVGLGRIGVVHAKHAQEVAAETQGCEFVALVDADRTKAQAAAGPNVKVYGSIEDMLNDGQVNAAVVCTPTEMHAEHAGQLIRAGVRVLLEKPMTESLEKDIAFAQELDEHHPNGLMLAFQRRFDAPLQYVKTLMDEGVIGRVFKVTSILEDSGPAGMCDPVCDVRAFEVARGKEIPVQIRGTPRATGTDANAIQLTRDGVAAGLVGIPNRYMHSPVEVVSLSDLDRAASLLAAFCDSVTAEMSWIP